MKITVNVVSIVIFFSILKNGPVDVIRKSILEEIFSDCIPLLKCAREEVGQVPPDGADVILVITRRICW